MHYAFVDNDVDHCIHNQEIFDITPLKEVKMHLIPKYVSFGGNNNLLSFLLRDIRVLMNHSGFLNIVYNPYQGAS